MVKKDIEYLNRIMSKQKNDLVEKNSFSWLYPFTNENISAYYSTLDFKDKNVLTVTSSGDHIFNAFLLGARNVEAFDSNPLSKYYVELKKIGIEKLSYEEFLLFFYNGKILKNSKYFLDLNLYNTKIRNYLNEEVKYFWDYLFENYSKKDILNSFLFTDDYLSIKKLIKVNDYLKEENFYKLQRIIKGKSIIYNNLSIDKLNELKGVYDLVILSNVPAFFEVKNFESKIEELKATLNIITHENSKIVLCYLYANSRDSYAYEGIYDSEVIDRLFSNPEYIHFKSSDTINYPKFYDSMYSRNDSVILLDNEKNIKLKK